MARVFSAVDIEDESLLKELEQVRDALDLGFNPVNRSKMHVTLEFFEDIGQEEIDRLKKAMGSIELEPFKADIKGVGVFPDRDYIRVVWAGMESRDIYELYDQVSRHGVEPSNDHDFTPHVTLMRVKNLSPQKKRKVQKSLREFQDHFFGTLEVDSVKLFESRLTGKGSEYQMLHEEKL
ncbi:MAG: RNA 2',3'-cyclic phosphodiesterase [Candidatus Nanohaloarchaea archaeon]